jgi:deoxyribose-phosphate aldolase
LRERLGGQGGPQLIAAIGFPFGALPAQLRLAEATWAAAHGADELDVVPDFSALVTGDSGGFAEDLAAITGLGLPVRVVLDMARLPEELLATAVEASIDAGATGVQSGNGFGPPCQAADIAVLSGLCRGRCAIKAAGGIHQPELALELLEAGAALLGTSSAPELLQALRRPIA